MFCQLLGKKTIIGKRVHLDAYTIIYDDVEIGNDTIIGHHTVIRQNTKIGVHCLITNLCVLAGNLIIGNHVRINHYCHITQKSIIEDYVFIGQGFISSNDNKIIFFRKEDKGLGKNLFQMSGIKIKYGARIAGGVRILPNVIIGKHALVGMGAIVTKDVPDYAVVFGIPTKIKRFICPEDDVIIKCKINHRR